MAGHAERKKQLYDWDDYRSWDDGKRWEIIGGTAYAMSPAPVIHHQDVLLELGVQLKEAFRGHTCHVMIAPTDVKLSDHDIVQPDLLIVCDPAKKTRTHIEGAPDLVIEILSPSTALKDRTIKMRLYAAAGVKELWLVTLVPQVVEVYLLDGTNYRLAGNYGKVDALKSPSFPHLKINLKRVFDFPADEVESSSSVHEESVPYRVRKPRKRRT